MNRRLMDTLRSLPTRLVRLAAFLAVLIFVVSGCASRRPATVLIQPAGLMSTNRPDHDLQLRLVTYNIWGLPGWMTGARAGRYPQIARELERINPDIILLQEAWTAESRKSVPTNGCWSLARARGQHTFFQQNGLVTLSKYSILSGEFYPFSRAEFPDRFVNKGVLKVTVQIPGGRVLNIWNVHMQDGHASRVRSSQVRELIALVQRAEDGQIADLVGGDFNCNPQSDLWRQLVDGLGPSLQQISGHDPFVTWDGLSRKPEAGETIDHIFLRERAVFTKVVAVPRVVFTAPRLEERLSDHLGIEAEVNLDTAADVVATPGASLESSPFSGILAHRAP